MLARIAAADHRPRHLRRLRARIASPEVRQGEAAECGLAALAIILGYHGALALSVQFAAAALDRALAGAPATGVVALAGSAALASLLQDRCRRSLLCAGDRGPGA